MMIHRVLMMLFFVVVGGAAHRAAADVDWKTLQRRPLDEKAAENTRIWLGLERNNRCRTTVVIVGNQGDTLRHLFSRLMSPGYYNFYWDKKNDSGEFVDTGRYRYIVFDCGRISDGKLLVTYRNWERFATVNCDSFKVDTTVSLTLLRDSAAVTISVRNRREVEIDQLVVDSLMNRGVHVIHWQPPPRTPPGDYILYFTIGDYMTYRKVKLAR